MWVLKLILFQTSNYHRFLIRRMILIPCVVYISHFLCFFSKNKVFSQNLRIVSWISILILDFDIDQELLARNAESQSKKNTFLSEKNFKITHSRIFGHLSKNN